MRTATRLRSSGEYAGCDKEIADIKVFLHDNLQMDVFGQQMRDVLDRSINSARTGHYITDTLQQSAKTAIGTGVEIVLRDHLEIVTGENLTSDTLDMLIPLVHGSWPATDCKFSLGTVNGPGVSWMIPEEALGCPVILVSAWDTQYGSFYKLGVYRPQINELSKPNKDSKRGLLKNTRENRVAWITTKHPMPRNYLLTLPESQRNLLLATPAGPKRVEQAVLYHRREKTPYSPSELETLDLPDIERTLAGIYTKYGEPS